ncbi:MAG: hypothetical protein QOD00_2481 [Blastocatellia bacterium]|jgi:hypothetical protein|nr:hypothetical protein [Blastocatellia bacterium]
MEQRQHPRARSFAGETFKLIALIAASACALCMLFPRVSSSMREAAPANHSPEMGEVRFKEVGVGQRIFFGLAVIDEESDDVRVELVQKPASAKYNEKTLTVDWTPRPADAPRGDFAVRLTEFNRETGKQAGTQIKTFSIAVRPQAVPLPTDAPAPLAVETLISITDPERLAASNARWPITNIFERIAAIEASKQIKSGSTLQPATGASLFRDALHNLAALHHNEEIDPDSPRFNHQWDAENWRLLMVRPRVNKKIFELRLVYRNVIAPEPAYLMPRLRIVRGTDPDILKDNDLRQKNNEAFARLLHDAFFDGPNLKAFVAEDKKAYGASLADFIGRVVSYRDERDARMQANFAALPHNARLGGDDTLDEQGRYLRGNGWALGVMKVVPVDRAGKQVLAFANLPIDGFAASIKRAPDGKAFKAAAAPRFDPTNPLRFKGLETLVDSLGFTAIPDEHGEVTEVKPSTIDASSISRVFKEKYMVEETPLRDARRRLFEERGMTCIQCHVRNFDEGDYLSKAVSDVKMSEAAATTKSDALPAPAETRDIPRLFFIITPDEGRSEFLRRNEEEQVGNLIGVMRDYLGVKANLKSPFTLEWPFNTRTGRS